MRQTGSPPRSTTNSSPRYRMRLRRSENVLAAFVAEMRVVIKIRLSYFDPGPAAATAPRPAARLDPATGRSRLLGEVETGSVSMGTAVSPDGKTVLFAKMVSEGADLMLIENFR